ncbi:MULTISPECIES: calcium uniporter family protein [Micrococcaceae]|uniref:SPW repeat-containing protein n=1 Tax=Pseudarthrobacter defluvii TaxID=410837 RepID=A0ABT9UL31_9MICC|nr:MULTISPECIES: calcium uniporter family protein [Micrococcaceae]MDQ0120360.1 hypothetical protein [Pseudarthrobacter defluvii]BCW79737.1 hypothetical protein NicSoilC5_17560 [Arthrobacter sp. NicSoilC5]
MFTLRTLGGIALLMAGSSWLWLTPTFATRGVNTSGIWWGITMVLSLLTVLGFLVATWGLFARWSWWEYAALGSAALGLVALIPFWVAATGGGETVGTAAWNVFVHVLMVAGVAVLLLVPPLERWVNQQVMG